MIDFINSLPTWIPILVLVVGGFFAIWGLFDKRLRDRDAEKTVVEDRVRELYKEESAELQKKVEKMEIEIKRLTTENEVITKIFQGRDTNTLEFQKQGFEVMKQFAITNQMVAETHKIAIQNKNGLEKMGKNIEKLVKTLEKHLTSDSAKVTLPQGSQITVKPSSVSS